MSESTESNTIAGAQSNETTQYVNADMHYIQASYRLNGKNYLKWSQLVQTFLKGKGKLSHLRGTGPKKGDPSFDAWDEEDSMIMAWLWNSMTPEISDTCMFLSTATDIWVALKQTYSKARDAAQVFEIKVKIGAIRQGSKTVTEYANLLQNLWQELDHYRCIKTKCADDAVILKKFIEKDRVYDFLAGLNIEFDQVRVQILSKEELPPLNEVISLIRAEESRRGIMLESPTVEGSALVSNNRRITSSSAPWNEESSQTDSSKTSYLDTLFCTYCKKSRHTREKCWKLHCKPPNFNQEWNNKPKPSQAHLVIDQSCDAKPQQDLIELNQIEVEKLRALLDKLEKPAGICFSAHSKPELGEDDWAC